MIVSLILTINYEKIPKDLISDILLQMNKLKRRKRMKRTIVTLFAMILLLSFNGIAQFSQQLGQCNTATSTRIQCGYFEEGYQDGVGDAQGNRNNDYKRYRNKLDGSKYEASYQQGYDAGFSSIKPYQKWDSSQRNIYDDGFRDGDNDRKKNISRLAERYEGQYNRTYEAFYKQGYYDGFDNKARQYDTILGAVPTNNPTFPTNNPTFPTIPTVIGTVTGSLSWGGRVDDRVNIVIRGSESTTQIISGNSGMPNSQTMNGVLPRRPATISVNKNEGRGDAIVTQQPSKENNYTAIVQVVDSKRGADDYRLNIFWQSTAPVDEPYQSGRATWRGRVDITGNIIISGSEIQSQNISGNGTFTQSQNVSGYLARRPGSISVRKTDGRGNISIIQQPSSENDFIGIVQITDTEKGADDYEIEITW